MRIQWGLTVIGGTVGYFLGGKDWAIGALLFGIGLVLPGQFPRLQEKRREMTVWGVLVVLFVSYKVLSPLPGAITIEDRFASPYSLPEVGVGMTGIGTRMLVGTDSGVIFSNGDMPLVAVHLERNKRLRASFTVRDIYGNIAAEATDGYLAINNNVVYQMNKTDDFFEIINQKGDVLFQAMTVGGVLLIEGALRCKDGRGMMFSRDGRFGAMYGLKAGVEPSKSPQKLCQYPVPAFFGKCSPYLDTIRSQATLARAVNGYLIKKDPIDICAASKQTVDSEGH